MVSPHKWSPIKGSLVKKHLQQNEHYDKNKAMKDTLPDVRDWTQLIYSGLQITFCVRNVTNKCWEFTVQKILCTPGALRSVLTFKSAFWFWHCISTLPLSTHAHTHYKTNRFVLSLPLKDYLCHLWWSGMDFVSMCTYFNSINFQLIYI